MKQYFQFLRSVIRKELMVDYKMLTLKRDRRCRVPSVTSYIRVNTLELVANEIYENNVPGAVAELGVYQGEFAEMLNTVFPEKKLYLFDTFEGFHKKDTDIEVNKSFSTGKQDFSNTSIDIVLNRLPNEQNCIIKKGWFPESAAGVDDSFCFVSLDADLFKPIYDGLEFFYPRLNKGGYIFIHDFNNDEYKGVKQAVKEFCSRYSLAYTPMSDAWGTVIIAK
jgi:O-methyltransferase